MKSDLDNLYEEIRKGHSQMSPETRTVIGDLKTAIEVTKQQVEDLKNTVEKGFTDLKEMICEIRDSKANKWTENAIIAIIGGFITVLLGAVSFFLAQHFLIK